MMMRKWRKLIMRKIYKNLTQKLKIKKCISWGHKVKLEKDLAKMITLTVQGQFTETDTTKDSLSLCTLHQIVIDHNQIQECLQTQMHNNPHNNLHKLSLNALDADVLTAHK